jgi:hypothetical protein
VGLTHVRGRIAATQRFAWLTLTKPTPETLTHGEPSFELVVENGERVQVDCTHATCFHGHGFVRRRVTGPCESELEDELPKAHPFHARLRDASEYVDIEVGEGAEVDVWGEATYGPGSNRAGYRAAASGRVDRMTASHVWPLRRDAARAEPLSRFAILGAIVGVLVALFGALHPVTVHVFDERVGGIDVVTRWPFSCGVLCAGVFLRFLHLRAVTWRVRGSRWARVRSIATLLFNAYLIVFLVVPIADFRSAQLAAAVVASIFFLTQTVLRRRRDGPASRALLGREAMDGVIERQDGGYGVRTPEGDLARSDIAFLFAESPWDVDLDKLLSGKALPATRVVAARVRSDVPGWAVYYGADAARATLRRAETWDRAMPFVYLVFAVLAFFAWGRFVGQAHGH